MVIFWVQAVEVIGVLVRTTNPGTAMRGSKKGEDSPILRDE